MSELEPTITELEPTITELEPTATERLRALLDERGVEWRDSSDENVLHTTWNAMNCWFNEFPDGWTSWGMAMRGTPEQAIAATLGSCNCSNNERTSDSDATGGRQRDAVEVVRCRDCKFYTPESMTREERGFGVYENVWEPGGCFNPERCSAAWDSIAGQMVPVGIVTEPDGFCAWGKRRESK